MDEIGKGAKVVVNATAPVEAGTVGVVQLIRAGWGSQAEAVVLVPGFQERTFTVPLGDLSRA